MIRMNFFRRRAGHALVAGFFASRPAGTAALRRLESSGFHRSSAVCCAATGATQVRALGVHAQRWVSRSALASLVLGIFVLTPSGLGDHPELIPELLLMLAACALAGGLAGWLRCLLPDMRVKRAHLARFRQWIVRDETAVLVEVPAVEAARALGVMRAMEGSTPLTFVFYPPSEFQFEPEASLFSGEVIPERQLAANARRLARGMSTTPGGRQRGAPLLLRLNETEQILRWADASLTMSAEVHQAFALSAEWLLDNAYLVRGLINDVRRNLPTTFYKQLPVIAHGPQAGLPRIYAIAAKIVADCEGAPDVGAIRTFLTAFQSVATLDIGELWALPLMLRLALVECLRSLAIGIDQLQHTSEEADFWANRLITSARRDPERLVDFMTELMRRHPEPTPHFASELVAHLYDEEAASPMVGVWLDRSFGAPMIEVIQHEHSRQVRQQTLLANVVTACRRLPQVQWQDLLETMNRAGSELAKDPAAVYARMDVDTRNRYQHAIEEISRWSNTPEIEVVGRALALAEAGGSELERHVGYYLVDEGRPQLESQSGARPPWRVRARRGLLRHATGCYLGGLAVASGALVAGPVMVAAASGAGLPWLIVVAVLLLLPASELAVQTLNFLVTRLLPPRVLPKMSFREEGIPDECRTLVVVPMMLTTPDAIRKEVERLEIRFIGNPDPNLRFALISDFADAPRPHMPEDTEYLDIVARGIGALNRRHGPGRFFLFHRKREWSESERRWIGWERKRGKLEQLNRLLMGESAPELEEILCVGERAQLAGVRFVITLDSDTQLLRDTARRLVETLSHPLNEARLAPDGQAVLRGYTIIQPGVSATLPSASATLFSRIFADPRGIDPYTRAVSDVYQDLMGEGTYHGKGIYDLRAFYRLLSGRFPEAHLLSHDLLEGICVRVGLATDIELLDVFPSSYIEWWNRQHRWIRGDWQIADWLRRRVPVGSVARHAGSLAVFGQWKILDNLRRSLVPVAMVGVLIAGWLLSSTPGMWSLLIAALLSWPVLPALLAALSHRPASGTTSWRDVRYGLLRSLLTAVFLLDSAALAVSAIGRVAWRRLVSHRRLLEWETAQDFHRRARDLQRQFITLRLWIPALSALLFVALYQRGGGALAAAWPFLLLWALYPAAVPLVNRPAASARPRLLKDADHRLLRTAARRTWRYFDELVGPRTNWLPPDNLQEVPRRELFMRTSPTNIGLGMLSTLAAVDFGYITADDAVSRTAGTLGTLDKLERFEGHLLNWYDISSLEPLVPRYVSTVDSGNLIASLWALRTGLQELGSRPLIDATVLRGLADTLDILRSVPGRTNAPGFERPLNSLARLTAVAPMDLEDVVHRIRSAAGLVVAMSDALPADGSDPCTYWAQAVRRQVTAWNGVIDSYLKPVEILAAPPPELMSLGDAALDFRRDALAATFSLQVLATGSIAQLPPMLEFQIRRSDGSVPARVRRWLDELAREFAEAQARAVRQLRKLEAVSARVGELERGMKMRFLYDPQRRLFAVGYQVGDRRLDTSFYDLLASEARLTSLVAIARGEVPVEHWWALGRPFGSSNGRLPLLSWTGTMFEYLMPLLLSRTQENSLLDRACRDAVWCQMAAGRQTRLPWGISEAAFSALDRHHVYQYRAFGVQALALKRDQGRDPVVAPYASVLALAVDAAAAVSNLRRLATLDGAPMVGDYGYYEAIDYSRRRETTGEAGIVVRCFMAHHQSMSLLAIDNALHANVMQRRFHADLRISATEALLHEHIPPTILPTKGEPHEERPAPRVGLPGGPAAVLAQTPDTTAPRTHLLSNGTLSVMVTNAGGGYLRW
ncbi:MAG: glycosyl transferase, partial [Gammaproteobacteria bacterium]|nr:glycosyl transferase [Gammaproteobacteria bacterium]